MPFKIGRIPKVHFIILMNGWFHFPNGFGVGVFPLIYHWAYESCHWENDGCHWVKRVCVRLINRYFCHCEFAKTNNSFINVLNFVAQIYKPKKRRNRKADDRVGFKTNYYGTIREKIKKCRN